ncbi:hypothetical protein ES706_02355 [subsurface metagenome]
MSSKITSLEVIVFSTVFVFLAGLVIEVSNWLAGNSFWEYRVGDWGIWPGPFNQVVFGTVPFGVILGWILTGVIVGILTALLAKRTALFGRED